MGNQSTLNDNLNPLPKLFRLRQSFCSHRIEEIGVEVSSRLSNNEFASSIRPGQSVAIAVGSRGIDRIAEVVAAVVADVKCRGARPFVVPAMGSHGGATSEGQARTLGTLGVTSSSVGCEIKSSMETVSLGKAANIDIFFDHFAAGADHIIVVNRIKPHTRLIGPIQSGICKMLMIGLGKRRGAIHFHPAFRSFDYRLDKIVDDVIGLILAKVNILYGLAIIEDAFDSIGKIELVAPNRLINREPELLRTAIDWMPKLPFETSELLIVDEIGKEISGTGMDTNVIGRKWHDKMAGADEWPKIDEIYVRSLTEKTAGNASGIGIAEYTHRRLVDSIDHEKTRVNCVTANHATAAATPMWLESDRGILDAVCEQNPIAPTKRRWMRVKNTLDLKDVLCSEGYLEEAGERSDLTILDSPSEIEFDADGQFAESDQ